VLELSQRHIEVNDEAQGEQAQHAGESVSLTTLRPMGADGKVWLTVAMAWSCF
jgi:hypothetical protein